MNEQKPPISPEEANCQIIPIDAHTWRVEDRGVRFFVLEGTEKALLIDSGMQVHNAREIAESLAKLQEYGDAFDKIYPSHGSFPVAPSLIPALYEAAGKILAGEAEGTTETVMFGQKVKRYDMGAAVFLCDCG